MDAALRERVEREKKRLDDVIERPIEAPFSFDLAHAKVQLAVWLSASIETAEEGATEIVDGDGVIRVNDRSSSAIRDNIDYWEGRVAGFTAASRGRRMLSRGRG